MIETNRRGFVLGLAAATAAVSAPSARAQSPALPLPALNSAGVATDTTYWDAVRKLYAVSPSIVNLENGYWGIMAEPVRLDYLAKTDMVNRESSFYARTQFGRDGEAARQAVVAAVGAAPEEVALTRGATEALQLLIGGYNKLQPGDTVLYSDLDYDSMQYAMNWLKERRGVNVVKFSIPEPATRGAVLQTYQKVLADHPKAALLLVTHVSHRTGLVMPVAEIAALARARGVDVVLDAAHSWGQIDFKVQDLGVDFIGFNLHKWIGAPLGVGFMYVAKSRLADIDRAMGDEDWAPTDIRSRVHTGTYNFASVLALPGALALHQQIGPRAKALRLRYLRDYWVSRVRGFKGLEILTPDEPGMAAGITSFRLAGKGTAADNNAIVAQLRDQFGIFTVRRGGVAKGQCIRVSPAIYTAEADLDRLVQALRAVTTSS
jgi:selenocysteine lyase/cysteine desulfurase